MCRWLRTAVLLGLVAGTAACENPVSSGGHNAPAGIRLIVAEQVVVSGSAAALQGNMVLTAGQQSAPITVQFTNAAGDVIESDGNYWLKVTSASTAVADWQATPEGAFTGRIRAGAAGTASLRFEYFHGSVGRGHRDGDAFDIPVVVVPAT